MTPLLMCKCTDAVKHARDGLPDPQQLSRISELFKTLSDPTRSSILSALSCHELCVNEISEVVGISISAVSHQLRQLKQCRFVDSRREGKNIYYSISDTRIEKIFNYALNYIGENSNVS